MVTTGEGIVKRDRELVVERVKVKMVCRVRVEVDKLVVITTVGRVGVGEMSFRGSSLGSFVVVKLVDK